MAVGSFESRESAARPGPARTQGTGASRVPPAVLGCVVLGLVVTLLVTAQTGITERALRNPIPAATHFYDGVPRANPPFLGVTNWPLVVEVATLVVVVVAWALVGWVSWRQRRVHPSLVFLAAANFLVFTDPFVNWATYTNFDPRLAHLPMSWPYVSIVPSVEPLFAVPGYPLFLLGPSLLAFAMYRRYVSPRARPGSFAARHPLITIFMIGYAISIPLDCFMEWFLMKAEIWIYSQTTPPMLRGGTVQWGIWEPLGFSIPMAAGGMLLWRDDAGRTICTRIADRFGILRRHGMLRQMAVAFAILAGANITYGTSFAIFRVANLATHIARPFPYQEMKIYDPQHRYQHAGVAGPYSN
jgi:Spirocyclase AveC-like